MQAPVMSCQSVPNDNYTVVVTFPKSLRRRCTDSFNVCTKSCTNCCSCNLYWSVTYYFFLFFVVLSVVWIISNCHRSPHLRLEAMSIRDMAVYRNHTIPTPESPWQVDSNFNVTLATRNRNIVVGCFCTFCRVITRVEYRGQVIVQQEVPLGFGLKPQTGRLVSVELQGARFPLKNPNLGPVLESELRSSHVTLEFFLDTRYLRNDRKARWLKMRCNVVVKLPSNSSQSSVDSLISQDCMLYK